MQTDFKLYKVDMKYIRNLHNIDDKVLSVSPQTGKITGFSLELLLFVVSINIVYHFHRQRKNIEWAVLGLPFIKICTLTE